MIFLTPAEIKALTGRTYVSAQCAVLRERHIRFILDADGRPKVLRATIEERLGEKPESATTEPNFDIFNAA